MCEQVAVQLGNKWGIVDWPWLYMFLSTVTVKVMGQFSFDSTVLVSSWSVRCIYPFYIIAFQSITFFYIQHWDVFLLQQEDSGACSRVLRVVLAVTDLCLIFFLNKSCSVPIQWVRILIGFLSMCDGEQGVMGGLRCDLNWRHWWWWARDFLWSLVSSRCSGCQVCTGVRRWLRLRSHPYSAREEQS